MLTPTISIIANVLLSIAVLYLMFYSRVIDWYKNKKRNKEKRLETKIKKIVRDYLKELQQ